MASKSDRLVPAPNDAADIACLCADTAARLRLDAAPQQHTRLMLTSRQAHNINDGLSWISNQLRETIPKSQPVRTTTPFRKNLFRKNLFRNLFRQQPVEQASRVHAFDARSSQRYVHNAMSLNHAVFAASQASAGNCNAFINNNLFINNNSVVSNLVFGNSVVNSSTPDAAPFSSVSETNFNSNFNSEV